MPLENGTKNFQTCDGHLTNRNAHLIHTQNRIKLFSNNTKNTKSEIFLLSAFSVYRIFNTECRKDPFVSRRLISKYIFFCDALYINIYLHPLIAGN